MGNITQNWVDVLIPFGKDYSGELTASTIAKTTKVPQQTTARIINNLAKNNMILYKNNGKNKEFYLAKDEQANLILNIIESQKSLSFLIRNPKMKIILSELKDCCESIIVFGSYSSGKQKPDSDLDVVAVNVKNKNMFEQKRRNFPLEINPHFVFYEELLKLLQSKNPLALEIKNNHLFFGNVSKLVEVFKNG